MSTRIDAVNGRATRPSTGEKVTVGYVNIYPHELPEGVKFLFHTDQDAARNKADANTPDELVAVPVTLTYDMLMALVPAAHRDLTQGEVRATARPLELQEFAVDERTVTIKLTLNTN